MLTRDENGDQQEAGYIHRITIMFDHPEQGNHTISKTYPKEEKILILDEEILLKEFEKPDCTPNTHRGVLIVEYFDSQEELWSYDEFIEDSAWWVKEYDGEELPVPQHDYFFFDKRKNDPEKEWEKVRNLFEPFLGSPGIRVPHELWDKIRDLFEYKEKYEEIKWRMDGLEK